MNNVKKPITLLGSTGSIGVSTLKVIDFHRDLFEVRALVANKNIDLIEVQAKKFQPEIVAIFDKSQALKLSKRLPKIKVVGGLEGVLEAASYGSSGICVSAISGTSGILPTIQAIQSGKDIALANKEAMVSAGPIINKLANQYGVKIIPVDSEQSAIFQCIDKQDPKDIQRLILTASGGPFFARELCDLKDITVKQALNHPTWNMGVKNTIDSSTLMNKGLEVIEARWLFNIPPERIDVVIHPQSYVHSFVEFVDGSLLAQIAKNDMALPIQYAMTYPKREKSFVEKFDFQAFSKLEFFPPDYDKFQCLKLALEALKKGRSLPCFINAANEILVERFVSGEISWMDIGLKLEKMMSHHKVVDIPDIETIQAIHKEGREKAASA